MSDKLPKTQASFVRLGYKPEAVDWMLKQITKTLNAFIDTDGAYEAFEQSFPEIGRRFDLKHFQVFIQELTPNTSVPYRVLKSNDLEPLTEEERSEWPEDEVAEYEEEQRRFTERYLAAQQNVSRIRGLCSDGPLSNCHFVQSKQTTVDNGLPERAHAVSTPMGGQPGYRLKTHRR